MQYRTLGRTGLQVSVACLGTMTFGWDPDKWGSTEKESEIILDKAFDLGINFMDTANIYGQGASEEIIGNYLTTEKRARTILATKCHFSMDKSDPNAMGNSRRNIIQSCEASLKRLKTDWIDLYQIHRPQSTVPIDETLRALDDLIRQGKIRYIGSSTFPAWKACEAMYVAKSLGTNSFVTEQPPYNLLDRTIERELLPFCKTYDYGVICWSPLAGGILTGKYLYQTPESSRYAKDDPFDQLTESTHLLVKQLDELAKAEGMSLSDMALAWVANQSGITCPIIGSRRPETLEKSALACQMKLSDELLAKIDEIAKPSSYVVDYNRTDLAPNSRPMAA
jgi:aryl-alcohol dehydrogenase-like predicted oxidoreductase